MILKEIQDTIDKFFNKCEREEKQKLKKENKEVIKIKDYKKSKKNNCSYTVIKVNGKRIKKYKVVMEKHLGIKLAKGEIIHHIDHNKKNDKIENLILCQNSFEHSVVDSVLTDTPNYIKYKITKDRKLEWEIIK